MKYSILVVLCCIANTLLLSQNEAYYIDFFATNLGVQSEVKVPNGSVDLVSATHAIEVEWASNWKHSIGQAIWYGLQTNKKPGIILLMKSLDDRKYGNMLSSALSYAGLTTQIDVWYYPEDFGETFTEVAIYRDQYKTAQIKNSGNYTRNKNSGVRHNSSCAYFACDNCVPCGASDGKRPCGQCGG